jgi:tartrate-resistant acid phosphatase type 5
MEKLPSALRESRRRFLRQSFAFSALASMSSWAGREAGAAGREPKSELGVSEILMVGDWGYTNATAQAEVASGMRRYASGHALRPEALFFLGDNWYGELSGGASSPRWQSQFESMYPEEAFACPAYAVLGNHDYQRYPGSKVDAELAYASARAGKTRWTLPARWYRFEFPKDRPMVTFLALDSNMPFADGSTEKGRDFTLTAEQKQQQLDWLKTELSRPRTTPFLVVMAHHPVYSDGPHGDHPQLVQDWDPLFREHKVSLYLAGHDHDLQHLEFEHHPTSFFLSGGGGADLYTLKINPEQRGPYAAKVNGFSHMSISEKRLTLRHVAPDGRILHAFTKSPDGAINFL